MTVEVLVLAVRDLAVAAGLTTAEVAVAGTFARFFCGIHSQAAPAESTAWQELPDATTWAIAPWVAQRWEAAQITAAVYAAVDEAAPAAVFPPLPPAAAAYRWAAQEIAAAAGERCAGVVWAGAQATARWLRLYGGRLLDSLAELTSDPLVAAARRELPAEEKARATDWVVGAAWESIDARAGELLAGVES